MSSKKTNKLFNKIIILLIILIAGPFIKEKIDQKELQDNKVINKINDSNLEIYFFDVGQADSILIKEKEYTVLIDGGNIDDGNNIVKYLKEELNIKKINMIIGTHPHEDHIGGLPNIINNFNIEKIYLPNVITTSKIFEKLLNTIEDNNYKTTIPKIDEKINLNNMKFKILHTGSDETDLNNTSIVLKLLYGNTSYLFTGDIEEKIEQKILNKNIKSDVLKVSHHGSEYSTSEDFLNKVNPKYAIIQVGKNNNYNHPSSSTLKKLIKKDISIYRTDELGTIKITSDGTKINITTLKTEINGD